MGEFDGWFQVSRTYRTVARLPSGKTGVEALIAAADRETDISTNIDDAKKARWRAEHRRWAQQLGEAHAGDHYLRVYAKKDGNWRQLTPLEWDAFKRQRRGTYDGKPRWP